MTFAKIGAGGALALLVSGLLAHASGARAYRIVPAQSTLSLHVGKEGLFKGFGHEHDIVARALSGQIEVSPGAPGQSRVSLTVESASLEVRAAGEPAGDAPKVQETMLGPKVLDVAHHPVIRFTSSSLAVKELGGGALDVQVTGALELRGAARTITFPVRVELSDGELRARGATTLRQTDFGIEPVRVAAGSVRVKDEVEVHFALVAVPAGG